MFITQKGLPRTILKSPLPLFQGVITYFCYIIHYGEEQLLNCYSNLISEDNISTSPHVHNSIVELCEVVPKPPHTQISAITTKILKLCTINWVRRSVNIFAMLRNDWNLWNLISVPNTSSSLVRTH